MTIITVTIPRGTSFDTTVPTSIAMGDSAATGSAVTAARRDHLHEVFSVATQAEVEAGTATTVPVGPGVAKYSQGVAKVTCRIESDGTLTAGSYNIASITDTGTGDRLVNILVDFSDAEYEVSGMVSDIASGTQRASNFAAGSFRLRVEDTSGTLTDARSSIVCHGDQ